MSTNEQFSKIGKFVIPGFFALVALGMIYMSTTSKTIDDTICFRGEFNEDEAVLLTMDDLEGDGIEEVVSDYKSLNKEIDAISTESEKLRDSTNRINEQIGAAEVLEDSLALDSLKQDLDDQIASMVENMNNLIVESNAKNKIIGKRLNKVNGLKILNAEVKSVESNQTKLFKYGGIGLLLMAVLMILFVANVIDRRVAMLLLPVLIITTVLYLYFTWSSVSSLSKYKNKRENVYSETKQRMTDLKEAILLFKEEHGGKVPESLDQIVNYVKSDSTIAVYKDGDIPTDNLSKMHAFKLFSNISIAGLDSAAAQEVVDKWADTTYVVYGDSSYNELRAWKLDLIVRDTSKTPVIEKIFTGPAAKKRLSQYEFSADSMKYVAYTKEPFVYRTAAIDVSTENDSIAKYKYRFEVRLKTPMLVWDTDHPCEPRKELIMGSLLEDKFSGNW